jgi:hypothetical protein
LFVVKATVECKDARERNNPTDSAENFMVTKRKKNNILMICFFCGGGKKSENADSSSDLDCLTFWVGPTTTHTQRIMVRCVRLCRHSTVRPSVCLLWIMGIYSTFAIWGRGTRDKRRSPHDGIFSWSSKLNISISSRVIPIATLSLPERPSVTAY